MMGCVACYLVLGKQQDFVIQRIVNRSAYFSGEKKVECGFSNFKK